MAVVVKIAIILVNFGACISYLIIIGDLLTSSIGERLKGTLIFSSRSTHHALG